ncbi:MAG: hypothetical protein QM730_12200 [Anaerolineales bacterium]
MFAQSKVQHGTAWYRRTKKIFIIAMATARGHGKPLDQQVFHCEGCGCEFILPPSQISSTCVYCGSPHVVNWESEEQLLAPDGVIPHAFDQKRAIQGCWSIGWMKTRSNPRSAWNYRGVYTCHYGHLILAVGSGTQVKSMIRIPMMLP